MQQWISDKLLGTIVVGLLFTLSVTLLLLVCYVLKVESLMGRDKDETSPEPAHDDDARARVRTVPLWTPVTARPELHPQRFLSSTPMPVLLRGAPRLWSHARRARHTAVSVYLLVGLAHVLTVLCALSYASSLPLDSAYIKIIGVVLLWPVGQSLFSQLGVGLLFKGLAAVLYLLAVVGMTLFRWPDAPGPLPGQTAFLTLILISIPPIVKTLVMNEWLKAVGTTVLVFVTGVVVGVLLTMWVAEKYSIALPLALFIGVLIVGVAVALSCLSIRWMVHRHSNKKASDRMAINAIYWLMITEWLTYVITSALGWRGLLVMSSFASFLLVQWVGFKARNRLMRDAPGNTRLLLLRTFTKRGRVERWLSNPRWRGWKARWARVLLTLWRILRRDMLIYRLEMRWRFVGSIQLIAGPDLAPTYIDVDEFVEWVTGQFKKRFILSDEDLERHKAIDTKPDPDGRYRVNEFFCGDEMWGRTLAKLLRQETTNVVLMDLRGFTEQNQGVIHELGQLFQHVPLRQIVLAVDRTTDSALLERKLKDFWEGVCECSPNYRERDPALRLLHVRRDGPAAARLLALLLCAAEERMPVEAVEV